ncbi:MAG: patatin-like phospholipase RssA [Proteobacteria bacterium]|nr:patatin-like phospholipase RssA [Pseudomonadota bacterium]
MSTPRKPRIGLVLGSGSARGWSHIGVIRALEEAGIKPDLVCGTSIGALVGAAYAAGDLDRFEQWVLGLRIREVVSFMDVGLGGGLLKGEKLMDFFRRNFSDRPLENLPMPFAAVATSLQNGAEVWLRQGSTIDAVRASIALPGLFTPVRQDRALLVDGGLVNPVPVSLARAMGADVMIAVDLGSDMLGRHLDRDAPPEMPEGEREEGAENNGDWWRRLQDNLATMMPARSADEVEMPSMLNVLTSSINVMQVRIARSRMAGEPPDIVVAPRLAHFGLLDFHRAQEAIDEGRRAVERIAHNLSALGV